MKIKWHYCGEAGYWVSNEGRFTISPTSFRSNVTPDEYELLDEMGAHKELSGERKTLWRRTSHYTVKEAKAEALQRAIKTTGYWVN